MQLCKIQIKVSFLWIPALCLFPLFHMTKIMGFIFIILSIHEMSHIIVAILCHYPVESVIIYPFGLSATIPHLGYGSLIKETMIIAAGPLSQIIFPLLFLGLNKYGYISNAFYTYLLMMNANIMLFNLLPIYPLDGGRLIQVLFHSIFRYKLAQRLTCIASIMLLILLFLSQIMKGASALVVQIFLFLQIIICWKEIVYTQMKFYHYRFSHPVTLPIIMNEHNDLYRGRYNMMRMCEGWLKEESWLARQFSKVTKR